MQTFVPSSGLHLSCMMFCDLYLILFAIIVIQVIVQTQIMPKYIIFIIQMQR